MENFSFKKMASEFFQAHQDLNSIKPKIKDYEYLRDVSDDMVYKNYISHWSNLSD